MNVNLTRVILYGAGGHGKVIADIIMRLSGFRVVGFLDDQRFIAGEKMFFGLPILGTGEMIASKVTENHFIISIGDNDMRRAIVQKLKQPDIRFAAALHERAVIALGVNVGEGTVAMAGAVINPDTIIGRHVILNTGCTVDHDCEIGDFAHISPGAHLGGNVIVGEGTHIGVGASVRPHIRIGKNSTIGAGATVITDIPDHCMAYGVPARIIKRDYRK